MSTGEVRPDNHWIAQESKLYHPLWSRLPVVLHHGSGCRAWDVDGNEYLDFIGGLAATSLGHAHPVVVDALASQATKIIQTSNLVYSIPQLELARTLVERSPFDR